MKIIALLSVLFVGAAFANYRLEDAPEMIGEKIENDVANTLSAIKHLERGDTMAESWVATRIRLLIAPFAAFDAKLLEIKVKPLIEFRWVRNPPRGWEIYTPPSDGENINN